MNVYTYVFLFGTEELFRTTIPPLPNEIKPYDAIDFFGERGFFVVKDVTFRYTFDKLELNKTRIEVIVSVRRLNGNFEVGE